VPRLSCIVSVLAVALALSCLATSAASAGTYTVRQCDWAAGNGHHDFVWQSAGAPTVDQYAGSGCGEFGLAVRNGGGGTQRTYPSGAYGGWFAYAPNGTVFTAFSGSFGTLEGCCVSGMTSYAEATATHDGQGGRAYLFQGQLGNGSWGSPSGLQGPIGRGWSSAASGFDARRVGFHLMCGPGFSCSQGAYADLRLRGRSFDFTLRDDVAPSVGEPSGTLLTGGWVRGVRTLAFPAHDSGGGLTEVAAAFGAGLVLQSPSSCTVVAGRYARLQPCPLARSGEWAVDTSRLPDGGNGLDLLATDAGGTTTRRFAAAYVDNHAPATARDMALAGGDEWRAANGFELRWTNPGGQHAPIAKARWQACPAAGAVPATGGCSGGERSAVGIATSGPIALPAAGQWDVRVWLEDMAGNADPGTATAAQRLRFDPDPPRLRFEPAAAGVPARVEVAADDLSGIASGGVETRRYGTAEWNAVPTERSDDRLIAILDGPQRAGGAYDVRARAADRAGNEALASGGVRTFVEHDDGIGDGQASPPPPAIGQRPQPRGSRPRRPRARVTMAARAPTARRREPGARRWGRRARRIVVAGGRPVRFEGRVGRPLPRYGKLVEVQAYFRGRWRTISAVRARRDGRWRFRYTFAAASRRASYRLRARVPVEAGYRFAAGASRPVRVTVLPHRR